ncbi:MAG: hypothetical protein U5N56_12955 [Candidatus Marinimicrobia bacterium]|nr:hypothetical protein [Candidatus Neomarinimicrobiota bacterium]
MPEGIEGFDAWSVLYCDPIAWLEAGTVDHITPQCYWPFGGGQDYGKLIPYWSRKARKYERHFYPGQALYRAASDKFPEGEIPRQIRLNRSTDGCQGSVYFTANNFFTNPKNTIDSMRLDLYEYPALWPVLPHREGRPLPSPVLFAERGNGEVRLSWEPSEDAWGYVIYRSKTQKDLGTAESILTVTRDSSGHFADATPEQWFYAVTSLDPYKRESRIAKAVYDFVVPRKPADKGKDTWGRVCFKWEPFAGAESYHIQVAADRDFEMIVYQERLLNTTTLRKKLKKDMKYYWRIKADNNDVWSPVWSFSR